MQRIYNMWIRFLSYGYHVLYITAILQHPLVYFIRIRMSKEAVALTYITMYRFIQKVCIASQCKQNARESSWKAGFPKWIFVHFIFAAQAARSFEQANLLVRQPLFTP